MKSDEYYDELLNSPVLSFKATKFKISSFTREERKIIYSFFEKWMSSKKPHFITFENVLSYARSRLRNIEYLKNVEEHRQAFAIFDTKIDEADFAHHGKVLKKYL